MADASSVLAILNIAVLAFLLRSYILNSSSSVDEDDLLVEKVNASYDYIVGTYNRSLMGEY